MNALLREFHVWRHSGVGSAVRYVCFENLSVGRFCVQSADFFRLPVDPGLLRQHERPLVELFLEQSPQDRCAWFASIEAAIKAHDHDFA